MAGHIHPLKIPTKYYKPIGQVIVGWNLTEALRASIIWKLHKIKDVRKVTFPQKTGPFNKNENSVG